MPDPYLHIVNTFKLDLTKTLAFEDLFLVSAYFTVSAKIPNSMDQQRPTTNATT